MSKSGSILSSIKWTGASQIGRQLIQYATFILMARALSSVEFGTVAMAMVVTGFLDIFKDLGTSSAIIQRPEISDRLISSLFWLNVLVGGLAGALVFGLAPMAGWYYHEPRVVAVLRVLSLSFLISCISIMHKALLTRRLAFKALAKIELAASTVGSGVGLACAYNHCGEWSLVWQTLSSAAVGSVCLWLSSGWRPAFAFGWPEVKSVSWYSLNLTGFSVFNYFCRNADTFIIGRFLGAELLGIYTLAYKIMLYPIGAVSAILGRVLFPFFSRLQDDLEAFRRTYLNVVVAIASATFPMMIGLWLLAKPFVLVVLGPKWSPVALQLLILCPVGLVQSIDSTTGPIFTARGRTGWLFGWGVVTGILSVVCFWVGVQWGIVGVAMAYLIFNLVLVYPGYAIPFSFITLPLKRFLRHLWIPLRASLVMAICVGLGLGLLPTGASDLFALCVLVPLGIVTYAVAVWVWNKQALLEVIQALGNRVHAESGFPAGAK